MNPAWVETYASGIFQIQGLAFFALGLVALLGLRREITAGLSAHFGWLAAFGMLHGLQGFVEGERLHTAATSLVILSTAMMLISFAALLEFGRRLWNERPGGIRLAAIPLYVIVGLGITAIVATAPAATAGLELGARFLMAAPGAVLAGFGLLAQSRATARAPDTIAIIDWPRIAALVMFCYAALALLLSLVTQHQLMKWAPTTEAALASTAAPMQLAYALCALLLVVCFAVLHYRIAGLTTASLRRVTNRLNGFVYRCLNNPNWTVTFMSEGGQTLTGYPTEDFLLGIRHFADQIHPDDQERVWREVQSALAVRREFQLQYRMLDRDGVVRWCYEEGRGVFDTQGELLYLEGLVRNDDERHRAESGRRRMQSVVENSPQGVGWAGPDGTVRYANAALRRLLAVAKDAEISAYRLNDFFDQKAYAKIESMVLPAVQSTGTWTGELPLRALDGRSIPTLHSMFILQGAPDEPRSIANVVTDLSELRQIQAALAESESRHRQLFELTSDGIAYADTETMRIVSANASLADMLGYSQDEMASLSIMDLHPKDLLPWVLEQFDELANDRKSVARDIPMCRRDGSIFYADVSASWMKLDGTALLAGIFRDVSERRQEEQRTQDLNQDLEARVRERTAELERANAAKNEFLSRMSHELRTPLNAILGFTHLLQLPGEKKFNEQQVDNINEIRSAGEHLLRLVNELLDLARIESGQLEINPEPVALTPIVEQSISQIKVLARERDIDLTLHSLRPCSVLADPLRLQQVLLNLLSNAVKYNRTGGLIEVSCTLTGKERVQVRVRDTGHGLTKEEQERLFRPFERLESAYEGIEGTGIGLALAKRFIEGMQGTIGVESVPGEGSSFWFDIPLCEAEPGGDGQASAPGALATASTDKSMVLYVEDNPANRRLVEKTLGKRDNIELVTANNAEDGLALATRSTPALILLDINLPGMNAFEALQQLRAKPSTRDIPVIAVTANAMQRDIERGMAAGFQDYLIKPIDLQHLLLTIERHLKPSS